MNYTQLIFGEQIENNWGIINIYDINNKPTDIICIRGPLFDNNKLDELLKTKKMIGLSAYQNFPQPLINVHDDYKNNIFLQKYEDKVILWCHCFKDPQNYLSPGIPKLLYSDSDQYNSHVLYPLANTIEKEYDFFCSMPSGNWNSWIRGKEVAVKWLNYMADIMNLKILVCGKYNENEFSKKIDNVEHLPWNEFIKKMNSSKFLINFSRYDASPRIIIEALSLNIPVLLNENILGGWKYINKDTGKLFFYDAPIEQCINNFIGSKYDPLKWMKLHFNSDNNKILLANTINKLISYKYEDILDGILYINLTNRVDRNDSMLDNFKNAEIPSHLIHRIDAVLNNTCGHLGCSDSHIKAFEYAKEMKWKRFLILEDDIYFKYPKERMLYILSEFLKNYQNKWDVLMLNTYWTEHVPTNTNLIDKLIWGTTSNSYIVNEQYIDILLDNLKEGQQLLYDEIEKFKISNPGEKKYTTSYALDQYWGKIQRRDNWYITIPYICDIKYSLLSSIMA